MIDAQLVKKNFPILNKPINGKPLIYLDSTATSLKPTCVIDAITEYYSSYSANVFRGIYSLSEKATEAYEKSREITASFIHANSSSEIIFTRNTTESINLVAYCLSNYVFKEGDGIITTVMEHHSNFVPWQYFAKKLHLTFSVIGCSEDGILDINSLLQSVTKKTRVVTFTALSNVLGTINPVKKIVKAIKKINPYCLVFVDAAQAVPHMPVDVADWGADFIAFSSHKMCGPTGIGVFWCKKEILEQLPPFLFGGDMIREVTIDDTKYADIPHRFEAGTPHIAGVIGLRSAIQYLNVLGMDAVRHHEKELTAYAFKTLSRLKKFHYYGSVDPEIHAGVIAFTLETFHPHDIAQILDSNNICVRSGMHCAMPLHTRFHIKATTRASFYLYTTKEDINALAEGLENVHRVLK